MKFPSQEMVTKSSPEETEEFPRQSKERFFSFDLALTFSPRDFIKRKRQKRILISPKIPKSTRISG